MADPILREESQADPTFLRLAQTVEALTIETAAADENALNVAILRATTRQPWIQARLANGSLFHAVTDERYGPNAIGNPVCSFPAYTGSTEAALEILEAYPQARLMMVQGQEGEWSASVCEPRLTQMGVPNATLRWATLSAILRYLARVAPAPTP